MAEQKLYAVMIKSAVWSGDYICTLVDEAGDVIYEHISSSVGWGRRDLEAGLKRKCNIEDRFPEGYEIIETTSWTELPTATREAYERATAIH